MFAPVSYGPTVISLASDYVMCSFNVCVTKVLQLLCMVSLSFLDDFMMASFEESHALMVLTPQL